MTTNLSEEQAIRAYMPAVRIIAGSYARRFRGAISFDDLFQEGLIGALFAIRKPATSCELEAQVRREAACRMIDAARIWLHMVRRPSQSPRAFMVEGLERSHIDSVSRTEPQLERDADRSRAVAYAQKKPRQVLLKHDYVGMTAREIAMDCGLSESRVWQMYRSEIEDIRRAWGIV